MSETPLLAAADLLLELQRLTDAGLRETDEAEAVCDRMEALWDDLGDVGQDRLNGLSADAYALSGDEIAAPFVPECIWSLLVVLRSHPNFLTDEEVHDLRMRCYAHLGLGGFAAAFRAAGPRAARR